MTDQTLGTTRPRRLTFARAKAFRNLRLRVISGIAMLGITLACLFSGEQPFALLVVVIALIMSWEWGRVVRGKGKDLPFLIHAIAVCTGIILATAGQPVPGLFAILAGAIVVMPLGFGRNGGLSAFGVLYVGVPAIVLIWLRTSDPYGALAILYLLVLVWSADTAAFAGGRLIGGYKLWPSISPNKTWAGFVFGVAASTLVSVAFSSLAMGAPIAYAAAVGLGMGILSQGGDLAESALKRGHGVKDASDLIPGHGGVMDRMDGVVTVACAAGLIAFLINANTPANALLSGT